MRVETTVRRRIGKIMKTRTSIALLAAGFSLSACVVAPPTGPQVVAMPAEGKTLSQFQNDDYTCRSYASQQTGNASPAHAANQSAVGSAVVGTALGAAAGAALGAASGSAGTGAAIGAGSGLLLGSLIGAGNASASADDLQQRYDVAYAQCMTTQGNKIEAPPPPPPEPEPQPVYMYAPPPPPYYYYPEPYYGPPGIIFEGRFGNGWGRGHGGRGRW
jgi:hypothetical protein